jgi:hypothetical protein
MRRYGMTTGEYKREKLSDLRKYQIIINTEQESMMEKMNDMKDVFGKMLILMMYKL